MTSKKAPLVSIIMPVYNAEEFIEEAITSVLNQDYKNIEFLIINDGSNDGTKEKIDSFHDPRIRSFSQENRGTSVARNVGLDEMIGDFFTFHDADDIMPPRSISSRLALLVENQEVTYSCGGRIEKDKKLQTFLTSQAPVPRRDLKNRIALMDPCVFMGCGTWLYRNAHIEIPRFPEGWTHCEDIAFMFELVQNQHMRLLTSEVVQIYRRHGNSTMANLEGLASGYEKYYKKIKMSRVGSWIKLRARLKIMKIVFLSTFRTDLRMAFKWMIRYIKM